MIKLIAFDWNGTLLSDTSATLRASNETFKLLGLKPITLRHFQETFTVPIADYYVAHGWKREDILKISQQQSKTFHEIYEPKVFRARTRGGTKDVLKWLRQSGIPAIIYSNHTINDITRHLKRLGIYGCIPEIIGRSEEEDKRAIHVHQRHKEDKLKAYIKRHKIKPSEVVSVGDTCEEIEISKSLGLKSVAITGGYNSASRLKKCRPDFLIHNLKDLIKIIKTLNAKK